MEAVLRHSFRKVGIWGTVSDKGYEFYLADPTKEVTAKDQKLFYQLSDFIDQTGLLYDSQRVMHQWP